MPEPHRRPRRAPLALAFAIVASLCALAQVKAVTAQIATPVAGASGLPGMRADTESLGSRRPTLEALGLAGGGTTVRATDVDAFLAIGFSYLGPKGLEVSVRVDLVEGGWTEWTSLERAGESTETSAPERRFTEPLAMGQPARGYEVVVPAGATDVRVHLIREDATKTEPREVGPTTLSPSAAGDGIPGPDGIRSRASWGARVRNQTDGCGWGARPEGRGCVATDGVIHAVVHHTVHANDYPASAVPTILRSIQAFHMDAQGWDDIGYNFLVDRFGTIWEGRAGGADRPVVGAHTMGFNTSSVGVAIVGTFESAVPTAATLESVSTVIAWKFAQRNVDPLGSTVLVSHGGDLSPEFELVPMDNIAGHRQLGQTSCPGAQVMSRLPQIRQLVAELM
ncbi:MAG TPA: peptidoglycan recognition protein, partial [Acidimicrobiales bacterium]|nr:peptidoglycan recognition protein [Acidimicrobiales bacterium]